MKKPKPSLGGEFPSDMWERIGTRLGELDAKPAGSFTRREFMENLRIASESTADRRLRALVEKGVLKKISSHPALYMEAE